MIFEFKDKNVLITGGSKGIGYAAAKLFAKCGANVMITYRTGKRAAEKMLKELSPGKHAAYALDVTDPSAIEACFNAISKQYASLDILVNNAGVFIEHPILDVSFEEWNSRWEQTLKTNLLGAANMCYYASRLMVKQRYGKMINISSRGAFRGEPDHPAYGASKAGLNAMSQSLAVALAPYNISVHIIAPGFVDTDMAHDVLKSPLGEQIKKQSPFGRVAQPDEVARLVAVYASDGLEFTSAGIVDINGASYLRS